MDHAQLTKLAEWLEEFTAGSGLSQQSIFNLDLVLTEAITNVIDYSRQVGKEGKIELACAIEDGSISVRLTDDGPPFDPTAYSPAALPKTLVEASPGGLGIHLIRQYTSSMRYRREHDRNVLCLTLPMHTAASAC